jgi:hypothetical protein
MAEIDAFGGECFVEDAPAFVVAPAAEIARAKAEPARHDRDVDRVAAGELQPGAHIGVDGVVAEAEQPRRLAGDAQ